MYRASKSRLLWKITVLFVICCYCLPAQGKYGGGTGEPNDPYLIYTAEQMNAIGADSNDWDKHFLLCADIDLVAYTGSSFNIIGSSRRKAFTGVFYGDNHTISNFKYDSIDAGHLGIFGFVRSFQIDGEISNLGLIKPDVNTVTGHYVGSLVGHLIDGKITNCYVEGGSVKGRHSVGGLVGYNGGTITNCYAVGSVSGTGSSVGGLVGYNQNSIVDCYTSGNVSGGNDSIFIGGLCGKSTGPDHGTGQSRIQNCFSKAAVTGNESVGGLIGHSGAIVTGCYSRGNISGDCFVGGLIGRNGGHGRIINCYSTGSVVADEHVGGLVGYDEGAVLFSFWDIETSGQDTSDGGTGKTTAEMQMASTFIAWGCEPVWTIDEGNDYPRLVWENIPGELIATTPSYGGGSGEPDKAFLIYTAEQLNKIGLFTCHWDKHFKLMADIDLAGFTGPCFNIIGFDYHNPFSGEFDGNGHTISNFNYTFIGRDDVGLFGYVRGAGAEIKNLRMVDPNVYAETAYYAGSLVGGLTDGTITGCYIEGGSVYGHSGVGGLIGYNNGTIDSSYSTCIVSGDQTVGGLVGINSGKVSNSYATGGVLGDTYVGGLAGYNHHTISNCHSTASVWGNRYVGGLVGYSSLIPITNSYSTGSVSGDQFVGGFVGYLYRGTIANCYSTDSVMGDEYVGGFVGYFYYATITNCYSKGGVMGTTDVGGLVGYYNSGEVTNSFWDIDASGQNSSDGGTGLPTAQMQMMSTFTDAGWDFVGEIVNGTEDIWWIPQGDYPHLWWEGMQVPMKLTPGILNCRSRGGWIKARLTLPEGFTVADVDSNILGWINPLGIEADYMDVFVDEDGLVRIEMAFDRGDLCEGLTGAGSVEITVGGFLINGQYFYGTDTIKIK